MKSSQTHGSQTSKVLLIGIDGATFDLINPWINDGFLPNIKRLMEDGTYGALRSTIPPITGAAWPSFKTGRNPGKTGVPDFAFVDPQKMELRLVNSERINAPTIWEALNAEGRKTIVLFEPTSYPAKEIDGIMVAGFLSPTVKSGFFTYPEDILEKYGFDRHCLTRLRIPVYFHDNRLDDFEKDLLGNLEKQTVIAIKLMERECWDFFMVHFFSTDLISHAMWKFMDKNSPIYENSERYVDSMLRLYRRVDESVGNLLSETDREAYVIIMSDHGFGPTLRQFFINQWLVEKGLLKRGRLHISYLFSKLAERVKGKTNNDFANNMISIGEKLILEAITRCPTAITNKTNNLVSWTINKLPKSIKGKIASANYFRQIDWERTKAYALHANGGIYINLRGRESRGTVPSEKYEEIRNHIIKELETSQDENGHKSVHKVYKREEIYWGEYMERMPDLIPDHFDLGVEFNCSFWPENTIFTDPPVHRSGTHRSEGIFIISGKGIKKNKLVKQAHIMDICPTILYLMGLPISENMDGRVLKDCFVQDYLDQNPIRYDREKGISSHEEERISTTDDDKVIDTLKGLGYM